MGDELADQLLAAPVVDRRVDEVDPLVEHRVEQRAGVLVADLRARRPPRSSMAPNPRVVTSRPVRPSTFCRIAMSTDLALPADHPSWAGPGTIVTSGASARTGGASTGGTIGLYGTSVHPAGSES